MKIVNNSSEFKLIYNDTEYIVPEGSMEITNDPLGVFILKKSKQWGKKVIKTENTKKVFIKPIVTEVIKKEELKEELKEESIKKDTKDKVKEVTKTNKKIKK